MLNTGDVDANSTDNDADNKSIDNYAETKYVAEVVSIGNNLEDESVNNDTRARRRPLV